MTECLYQGCFNPIHNAHIAAAEYAHKRFNFDRIVFIPAFKPPHKPVSEFDEDNALKRLEMIQLAVSDIPYFTVSAAEYMRRGFSYTYDTVKQIYDKTGCTDKIYFITGTDAFIQIENWYKTEQLKELLHLILFVRENNFDETPFLKLKEKGYNYSLMQLPFSDISSSMIREKCRKGQSIDNLVPQKVSEYIEKHGLYKI